MLSTSFILILLISTSGIPSTTTNGEEEFTVPNPRMIILALSLPAIPDDCVTASPGISPDIPDDRFVNARLVNFASILTAETAPVRFTFFCVPNPITTTSSTPTTLASITTDNVVFVPNVISWDVNPTKENTSVLVLTGTERENSPSKSVTVPMF